MSRLSKGQSRKILHQFAGTEYLGNAPCLFRSSSGSLATAADTTMIAGAPTDGFIHGLVVKVTTLVAGDSTLSIKVAGTVQELPEMVIPDGTAVGTVLRWTFPEPVFYEMAQALAVAHDATPTAGVAFMTLVCEPL